MTASAAFKATEMKRAVKTVQAAGLTVVRTRVYPDGSFELFHDSATPEPSAYEKWSESRGQGKS